MILIFSIELTGQIGVSHHLTINNIQEKESVIKRTRLLNNSKFAEVEHFSFRKRFLFEDIWKIEEGFKFYIGVGYGPETIVSLALPKFSLKYFYPITNSNLHFYTGGEVMVWLWGTFWMAGDITAGIKYGPLTIENSVSVFYYPKSENEAGVKLGPYFHSALNPKVGIYIFDAVWLRFGPSIIVYKKYENDEWPPIESLREGRLKFNFELLFNTAIGNR